MAHGTELSKDVDLLEAQVTLALAEPTLPKEKRVEFEQRLEAIRLKTAAQRAQWS